MKNNPHEEQLAVSSELRSISPSLQHLKLLIADVYGLGFTFS
jgi:hypothetical protein